MNVLTATSVALFVTVVASWGASWAYWRGYATATSDAADVAGEVVGDELRRLIPARYATDSRAVYALSTRGPSEPSTSAMEETPMNTGQAGDGPRTRDLELGRLSKDDEARLKSPRNGRVTFVTHSGEPPSAADDVRAEYAAGEQLDAVHTVVIGPLPHHGCDVCEAQAAAAAAHARADRLAASLREAKKAVDRHIGVARGCGSYFEITSAILRALRDDADQEKGGPRAR